MTQRLIGSVTTPVPHGETEAHSLPTGDLTAVLTEKMKASNSSLALLNGALGSCPYSPSFLPHGAQPGSPPPVSVACPPGLSGDLSSLRGSPTCTFRMLSPGLMSSPRSSCLPGFPLWPCATIASFTRILPLHPLFSVPVFVLNPVTSPHDCQAHPLNWPMGLPAASSPG